MSLRRLRSLSRKYLYIALSGKYLYIAFSSVVVIFCLSLRLKMVTRTGDPPRGSAAAAGLRRRRMSGAGAGAGSTNGSNMLRFYTDDAPGLKITPTVVLVMSLGFIGFVTALHVVGKLYHYRAGV